MGWQRVKLVRGYTFQDGRKGGVQDMIVTKMALYLVSKMANVVYRVTHSRVVIEC